MKGLNVKLKLLVLMFMGVAGSLLSAAPVYAGITIGGQEAPTATTTQEQPKKSNSRLKRNKAEPQQVEEPAAGGIRQAAPVETNTQKPKYQQGDLLKMAEDFRMRYRKDKQKMYGEQPAESEYRYGFVLAFFDTQSLLDPTLGKQLGELEKMDGIQFKLLKSKDNVTKSYKDYTQEELKKMAEIELPMARDDTNGRIASNYKVDKFPSVLYEIPSGEVVRFHVPNTMESVFRRIRQEARKVDGK